LEVYRKDGAGGASGCSSGMMTPPALFHSSEAKGRARMMSTLGFQHKNKKADVMARPQAFHHVGLLVNEPPSAAGLLFT
jgi:hypothetical protein